MQTAEAGSFAVSAPPAEPASFDGVLVDPCEPDDGTRQLPDGPAMADPTRENASISPADHP